MKRVDTPHGRYYQTATGKLPSVTTLLGLLAKPALIPWAAGVEQDAWRRACEVVIGGSLSGQTVTANALVERIEAEVGQSKAYLKTLKEAQDIGTAVHERIDWELRGEIGKLRPKDAPILGHPKALEAFDNWLDWRMSVEMKVIETELKVSAPKAGFAGTLDTLCVLQKPTPGQYVIDYKTGAAVYYEALAQNGMYQVALGEMGHETAGGFIVRLPKTPDDPTFDAVLVPPLADMRDGITALVEVYGLINALKATLPAWKPKKKTS